MNMDRSGVDVGEDRKNEMMRDVKKEGMKEKEMEKPTSAI